MLQLNTKSTKSNTQGFDEIATKVFNGHIIRTEGNMVCLTDIWKASGEVEAREVWRYRRSDRVISQVGRLAVKHPKTEVFRTERGRTGGTWAHEEIALDYCMWISPEIHAWALSALKHQIQEERNPELKITRGIDATKKKYQRLGMSDEWIDGRIGATISFHQLNHTLANHGCSTGEDYGRVHGAINRGCLGKSSSQLKQERGVKTTRDGLDAYELNVLSLTQMATKQNVERKDIHGSYQIAAEANTIGNALRKTLESVLA